MTKLKYALIAVSYLSGALGWGMFLSLGFEESSFEIDDTRLLILALLFPFYPILLPLGFILVQVRKVRELKQKTVVT